MKLSIYIIWDPSLFTNEQEKYSYEFAAHHVEKWVKGWSDHNLNVIMSSYAEELEFSSPKIRAVLGDKKNNTLRSKRELSIYFSAGLERFPHLKFKIIDFTVSDNKVILEIRQPGWKIYRQHHRKIRVRKRTCEKIWCLLWS